jgi:hypothetical protein
MVFGSELGEGTYLKSPINDVKKSHFLDLNDKEVENVNKGSRRVNNHVELCVKNAFDEWRVFRGLDTTRSIVDLSKDDFLKRIWWICFHLSFCKLQKKMATYILQPSNFYLPMFSI